MAFLTFGISLGFIMYKVNYIEDFQYNPEVSLNNQEFNVYGFAILSMGILSLIFVLKPKVSDLLCCSGTKDGFETCFKTFWSLVILILTLSPIILPTFIFKTFASYHEHSYVYYKPEINSTIIVQATTIHPVNGFTIDGFLKPYLADSGKTLEPQNLTRPILGQLPPNDKEIVVISRKNWELRKEDIFESNPLAILIIDNQQLRPSSPLPSFLNKIPTFLIRINDSHHFTEDKKILMQVWISPSFEMVHDPDWQCNSRTCLDPNFSQGYIAGTKNESFKVHFYGIGS